MSVSFKYKNVRFVGVSSLKAVIVDIQGKYAVALNGMGQFIKVKCNDSLKVGCEIEVPEKPVININSFVKVASIAAAFVFVMGLGFGVYSYNTPYSYIDIDINPSVEITANIYNKIIKVEALNEDGSKILSDVDYRNKSIENGVEQILQNAIEEGYIKENDENAVMLTVSSKDENRAAEVEKNLQTAVEAELKPVQADTKILVEKVTEQKRVEAKKQEISPGKLVLIEKLKEEKPDVKVEEYKNAPVKDIVKSIDEHKKIDTNQYKNQSNKAAQEKSTTKGNESNDRRETSQSNKSIIKEQQYESNKNNIDYGDRPKQPIVKGKEKEKYEDEDEKEEKKDRNVRSSKNEDNVKGKDMEENDRQKDNKKEDDDKTKRPDDNRKVKSERSKNDDDKDDKEYQDDKDEDKKVIPEKGKGSNKTPNTKGSTKRKDD